MTAIRQLLARPHLAVLICAAALFLRLVVPTGYMIETDHGRVAITICPGVSSPVAASGMAGMHGDMPGHDRSDDHGGVEMPCAFSGLTAASLGAIDPIQLAVLLVFVVALGTARVSLPLPTRVRHLRPPLRGPPA